jgi:hypothetical protein
MKKIFKRYSLLPSIRILIYLKSFNFASRWIAYMVLKPFPPNLRYEIYLLSLSCELIKNRPIPSSLAQKWKGDYLSDVNKSLKKKIFSN